MKEKDLEESKKPVNNQEAASSKAILQEASSHCTKSRRQPGPNGFFPDPIPAELSGIYLLGEGIGYKSYEVRVPPTKFGDGNQTAIHVINTAVDRAQNVGMPHSTILQKFVQGT